MRFVCASLVLSAAGLFASDLLQKGDEAFQQSNWSAAADAYSAAAKEDGSNGAAWFKLGQTYRKLSKNSDAVTAFQRAIAANYLVPGAMVRVAGALGADQRDAEAIEWLQKAADAGFSMPGALQSDDALRRLSKLPAAKPAITKMADNLRVCTRRPENQQFDFWVGDWTVDVSGVRAGTSHIEKTVSGCALIENWTGAGGIGGKSLNVFDTTAGKWRQRWVDESGRVTDYEGEFRDGAMRFETKSNGLLGHMIFTPLEGGRVRQFIEQSTDNGKTWSTTFDGIYSKAQ